jgi:DNA-binding transcriptional MerR regulator
MFRIGEFAQIAQVSGRQLRFYDELGLLKPVRIDQQTGYRYYSIRQLSRLNRILALKELGLSLEQIASLLDNDISANELRGMLMMKRAQIEQSLHAEEARLRHIESRIRQIDRQGDAGNFDVVMKSTPAQPFLAPHCLCDNMDEAIQVVTAVADSGARQIKPSLRDKLVVVAHNDRDDEKLALDIGYTLTRPTNTPVRTASGAQLRMGELAACDALATIVRQGTTAESHSPFGTIGAWIEANAYEIAGPCREVFLEPITGPPGLEGALVEIQFPLRFAA